MTQPAQNTEHRNFPDLHAIHMNEDFKNEFQLVLSGLQRLDGKIDAKEDLKQFATKEDVSRCATKEDLNRFATKEDLNRFATKEDLLRLEDKIDQKFATKADLMAMEERNTLRYATKEDLSQVKFDLVRWTFAFWVTLTLMILGLYLTK
jgi:hypothetical protein